VLPFALFSFVSSGLRRFPLMEEMKTMPSGVMYIDHIIGTGTEVGRGAPYIRVHYTGWLKNPDGSKGKQFDSSLDRGVPFRYPYNRGYVIQGWDLGLRGMKTGGKRTIHIPSHLGYGANGIGGVIPPNADLIFEIELIEA
jgi:FKBP-type peptidyl-prolyl cis-trans isomerase